MRLNVLLSSSLAFLLAGILAGQATPTVLNTNLQLRLVFDTPTSSPTVKMAKDPRNNQLYFLKFNGTIYSVNLTNSTYTQVYSSTDHGLTSGDVEGLCIGPDGTMYVEADYANGKYGSAKIAKGVLNGSGVRVWSVLAQTDQWPKSGGAYDHNDSEIIVSLDGQTLYLNCGSRTDHGEIESNGGTFPNTRDVGLTAKILQMPTSGNNLFLTNDLPTLLSQGYVFVQGTRNAFAFAFNAAGDMFSTENGPDRDMSDSFYWLRAGCHYGFPWMMGGMQNPQQYSNYNPANDPLLNPAFGAVSGGLYANDPTFPAPPTNFTYPVVNVGPSADIYRDQTNGAFINAGQTGTSLTSFTAHSSPLGLVFDTTGAMGPGFQYHGFCCRWTPGDPTGDTVAGPFYDASQDLLDLNMTKLGTTNYQMSATTLVSGFSNPMATAIISNKLYVAEYGGSQGLWEITFPTQPAAPVASQLVVLQQPPVAAAAGVPLLQQPVVAAEDNTGDIMTNYSGTVTASETAGGSLDAATGNAVIVTVSNGIAVFAGLYVTNVANGVTLTYTSGTLVSTNSTAFNVSASASQLLQVGVGHTIHLALVDPYQNPSHFSGVKMLMFSAALSPGADGSGATIGGGTQGTAVPVTFSNGTAVVTLVAHKAESGKTLSATDGTHSTASAGGAALALQPVIPAADNAYQIAVATTSPTVQTSDAMTLYIVDQYQNSSTYWGGKNITFAGLGTGPGGAASINGTAFGTATPVNFTTGTATATLVAQRGENSALLSATDGTLSTTNAGGAAPLLSPRSVVVANTAYFSRPPGVSLRILITDLLTNTTDLGGDTVLLTGVGSPSTNGISVTTNAIYVLYPNQTNNVADSFNYSVADDYGGSATGAVVISIVGGQAGQTNASVTMTNNVATLTFFGVPGDTYVAQRTTNLTPPVVWVSLGTNVAPAGGLFQVNDNFNDLGGPPAQAYYQLLAP